MIPGLSVEGQQSKPLRLNLDLSSIILAEIKPLDLSSIILPEIKPRPGGDSKNSSPAQSRPGIAEEGQSRPRPLSGTAASDTGDDIFHSDDDLEEEEGEDKVCHNNNNNTMQCSRLSEENLALRRENEGLREKMLAERRLYEEYQSELRNENQILEANLELMEMIKSRELERSRQAVRSSLEEKDEELRKNTETIQELGKLVRQERKNSAVLRGLVVEEMIARSTVKSEGKQVKGKQHQLSETELLLFLFV